METVSGWSIRALSYLLWAAAICFGLTSTVLGILLPPASLLRRGAASVLTFRSLAHSCITAWLPLLPAGSLWCLALQQGSAKDALSLVKAWRLPGWSLLLWVKTLSRGARACMFMLTATLGSAAYANAFVSSPVLRSGARWMPVSALLAMPYGASAVLVVCALSLDRPVFSGAPQSRAARLIAQVPAIASLAGVSWALAGIAAASIYVLTPATFISTLNSMLAAGALYCYTVCIIASAHLASIVMAERPVLSQYDAAGSEGVSLVRSCCVTC